MKKEITKRQKDLLSVIYQYIKDSGFPPSIKEMGEELGVASNQSVLDLLGKLTDSGLLKRTNAVARSIALLPLAYKILGSPPLVPFAGVTAAGAPLETIEIAGEWQEISHNADAAILKQAVSLVQIRGDSMINAGLNDGDVVLVQSATEFVSKDIVLAQIGNESTVKRFMSEDKPPYVYLKPENPKYSNILFTDDTRLVGKVISKVREGQWAPLERPAAYANSETK